MRFEDACAFRLPIGPHKGRTIDQVGVRGAGLEYLDWLRFNPAIPASLELAIETYLADPAIRAELNEVLGKGTTRHE